MHRICCCLNATINTINYSSHSPIISPLNFFLHFRFNRRHDQGRRSRSGSESIDRDNRVAIRSTKAVSKCERRVKDMRPLWAGYDNCGDKRLNYLILKANCKFKLIKSLIKRVGSVRCKSNWVVVEIWRSVDESQIAK